MTFFHAIRLGCLAAGSVVLTGVSAVSAASVGGVNSSALTSIVMSTGTGAPTVVAYENFTAANGTSLAGTSTDGGGKTWSVNPTSGTWTVISNQATSASSNTSLVIDAGASSDSVVVDVARNGATSFSGGATLNRNAAGTQFLTAEWSSASNGSIELWKYNAGWTFLSGVTNLYPGGIGTAPASITLKVTSSSAGVVTAFINGTSVASITLSAADQTTYKNASHQLFGLYQYTANGLTYDNFHLDNP